MTIPGYLWQFLTTTQSAQRTAIRDPIIHYKLYIIHYPMRTFNITLITSLLLIVGGFITPPIGQIDGSVLTAVGMLVLFATVEKIPEAIKAGRSIKVQKGNFCAEIEASD